MNEKTVPMLGGSLDVVYQNGDRMILHHVKGVRLITGTCIEIQCFGNDWVRHREVRRFVWVSE